MSINGSTVINLAKYGRYTISINVTDADPEGRPIDTEEEDWDQFAEDI